MNENVEQWNISKNAVSSERGLVASQHWLASSVGADALNKGGNAIDAAIACAFALNVVEPWMCGLGGSGYILIWLAKTKEMKVIDFQGILPKSISFEDYPIDNNLPETIMGFPGVQNQENILGYKSITVPGAVAGLSMALDNYGTLGIDSILSKTIDLAERGLPVDWITTLQIALESKELSKFEESSNIYLPKGFPPNPEQYISLGNLSKTLRIISEKGANEFYNGKLAEEISNDLKTGGSRITIEDLSSYKPELIEPLSLTLLFPLDTFPIMYGLKNFVKYLFILLNFFGFTIKQNPTPQLKVFNISLFDMPLSFNQLKIFGGLILFKSISATKFFGITLLIFSDKPPPVIFAQLLIKFLSINFKTSLTYILVGLISSVLKNLFFLRIIFFFRSR